MKFIKRAIFLLVLLPLFSTTALGQGKIWEVEVGGGANFAQTTMDNVDKEIGYTIYTEARCLFPEKRLYVGLQLNYNKFKRSFYSHFDDVPFSISGDFASQNLLVTGGYRHPLSKKLDLILGAGVGIGAVSDSKGAYIAQNEYFAFLVTGGSAFTLVAEPKVGLSINKHVNVMLSYKLQEKINRMALFTIGYAFQL